MSGRRRRHRLENLKITRVDLVDVPANLDRETGAGAHIKFYKRGEIEGRTMDRAERAGVLDDVTRVLNGFTAGMLSGADRGQLQRISKRAAALAEDPADQDDDRQDRERQPGAYLTKRGAVVATSGSRFEALIEKCARAENLSYPDAALRAAQLDPQAASDYQHDVAYGRSR